MDLINILLCVLFTPNVAIWGAENLSYNNINNNNNSNHNNNDSNNNNNNNNSNNKGGNIELRRNNRSSRNSNGSLLMLRPSTPSITHFVNDSFIIFCAIKKTSTTTTSTTTTTTTTTSTSTTTTTTASAAAAAATALIQASSLLSTSLAALPSSISIANEQPTTKSKLAADEGINMKWKHPNGTSLENSKGRLHIEKKSGLLALVFEQITVGDKGNWSCEATTADIKDRKSFELLVNQKISFDKTEMVQSAREGRDATVYCLVQGDPTPEISWLFNGEYINTANSSKHRKLSDGLFIKNVTQADAGEYVCRAIRITSTFSDSDQITILLRIQHKPHWFANDEQALLQYSYMGGSKNISCDAMGEPPPSFTWLHDGRAIIGRNYRLFYADYGSTLQIHVVNDSDFGDYKCKVANPLGMLERIFKLRKGEKPPALIRFQLRHSFDDGFDFDIHLAGDSPTPAEHMQANGYRVEYMNENDFKYFAGNWSYAKRKDFLLAKDDKHFILLGLKSNTTYLMRAASSNLAGLSDWSAVKIFATLTNRAQPTRRLLLYHHLFLALLSVWLTISSTSRISL